MFAEGIGDIIEYIQIQSVIAGSKRRMVQYRTTWLQQK